MQKDYVNDGRLIPYYEFIESCRSKIYESSEMLHKHHIIPRFMGGNDEDSNLIKLNPIDHLEAHVNLAKCFDADSDEFHGNIVSANKLKTYIDFYELNNISNISEFMSNANKGRFVGEKNGMFGRKHSEESIELMRRNRKGKTAGSANFMFGKTHSDAVKQAQSDRQSRKLIHILTGEKYSSIKDVAIKLGVGEIVIRGRIDRGEFIDFSDNITQIDLDNLCDQFHINEVIRKNQIKENRRTAALNKPPVKFSEKALENFKRAKKGANIGSKNPNARQVQHVESGIIFDTRKEARKYFQLSGYHFIKQFNQGIFIDLSGKKSEFTWSW